MTRFAMYNAQCFVLVATGEEEAMTVCPRLVVQANQWGWD